MITTLLAFLVTIAVLVAIHEWGHYRAAVACDVKVLRFSLGFGRVLWSFQRGETEFVVSAVPLGGYVKMLDSREGAVAPHEQHRAFNHKPLWQRAVVVAAGPVANLLLAIVLYTGVNWSGVQELTAKVAAPVPGSVFDKAGLQSGDEIVAWRDANDTDDVDTWQDVQSFTDLQWLLTQTALKGRDVLLQVERGAMPQRIQLRVATSQVPTAELDGQLMDRLGMSGPYALPRIGKVMADGPAQAAGLQAGDLVTSFNGQPVSDAATLRQWIGRSHQTGAQADKPEPIVLGVARAGRALQIAVTPVVQNVDDTAAGGKRARIMAEVGGPMERVVVRYPLWQSLTKGVQKTWDVAALSLSMLGKMLTGQASLKNLSGPVSIADYAGQSAQLGLTYYLGFLALVSVSLGVLNLLPLPVLDGGHLMYYLFEGLTGRPISDVWMDRLQRGGVALMLVMMSLALYNDFARLLGLH